MQSTTNLTLNLQLPNCAVTMYAVQNDRNSRMVQATLFDGDTAWTPPNGTLAIVRYSKPDGTQGFYDTDEAGNTAVTWSGNVATIRLAEQALTVAGDVFIQVNFYNASEERLSTFAWTIKVQKCAVTDDEIISTDYYNILSQQIAEILEIYADLPTPSTATPLVDGTGSAGTSNTYSRGDHVHPLPSLAAIGFGYASCNTAEATTAKEATLAGFKLREGAMPTIKFTYAVPANSKLNINSTGSKSIYISAGMSTAIPNGVIKAGDYVTFLYNGSQYVVQSIFRHVKEISNYGNIVSFSVEEVSS